MFMRMLFSFPLKRPFAEAILEQSHFASFFRPIILRFIVLQKNKNLCKPCLIESVQEFPKVPQRGNRQPPCGFYFALLFALTSGKARLAQSPQIRMNHQIKELPLKRALSAGQSGAVTESLGRFAPS